MSRGALVVVVAALWIAACSGRTGVDSGCPDPPFCGPEAQGPDAGSLSGCILGVWLGSGGFGSCSPNPCRGDAGPPECSASDCGQQVYEIFLSDGGWFEGSYVVSQQAGTWSSLLPPLMAPYEVEDGGIFWPREASSGVESATCTQAQLVVGEIDLVDRAPASVGNALESLTADGGVWLGLPFP